MRDIFRILTASKLNDLPAVCRSFWEDDEQYMDWFGLLDDECKCEVVADCFRRCLELNITDNTNVLRMMMYCCKGEGDDYEDADPVEEVQSVVIPTLPVPVVPVVPVVPDAETEELKKEILMLRRKLNPEDVPEKPAKPVPVPGRGRGRPPKYPNARDFKCDLCSCGLSSHGALFNHHHSKQHTKKVKDVLNKSIEFIKTHPDLKLKIIVYVCNKRDDPRLTQEDPSEDDIKNILDYVADGHNPISDCLLVQGIERQSASSVKSFSWKNVL